MDKEVESEILIELREIKRILSVIASNQEKSSKALEFNHSQHMKSPELSHMKKLRI